MSTPDALTVRRVDLSGGAALTQDVFNQFLRDAIATEPDIFKFFAVEILPEMGLDKEVKIVKGGVSQSGIQVYDIQVGGWERIR